MLVKIEKRYIYDTETEEVFRISLNKWYDNKVIIIDTSGFPSVVTKEQVKEMANERTNKRPT